MDRASIKHRIKNDRSKCNEMNKLLNNGAIRDFIIFTREVDIDIDDPPSDLTYALLVIRYYVMADRFDDAFTYFKKLWVKFQHNMRKRYISLILNAAPNDMQENLYLTYSAPYYAPNVSDLNLLSSSQSVLTTMLHHNIVVTNNLPGWTINTNSSDLRLLHMSTKDKHEVKLALSKHMNGHHLPKFTTPIKYVIDGANILFYSEHRVTLKSFGQLNSVILQLQKIAKGCEIVLVLHCRHFDTKFSNNKLATLQHRMIIDSWMQSINVVKTPIGVDDDIYSITIAVDNNSYIITNDQFRDHVNHISSKLRTWRDEHGITYELSKYSGSFSTVGMTIVLNNTPTTSRRIQMVNIRGGQRWLIPYNKDQWISRDFISTI